jgi:hypothetical protein
MDSKRRKSTRSKPGRAAKQSRRKPVPKSQPNPRRLRPGKKLPDLATILYALFEARALISVAHKAILQGDDYGPEESVLRMGVAALASVYDRFDSATVQIARFQHRNAKTSRGAR